MKATKYLYISIFILAGIVAPLSSCQKVLDQNPTDQLSSGTFWKTANDFKLGLAACYNTIQDYYLSSGIQDLDGISDNGVSVFSYNNEQLINQGITVSSHATDNWYIWGYQRLATYNIFLANLNKYTGNDMSKADMANLEAQVKLLRAMEYYRLWVFYGAVPLVTEPLTLETQMVPKSDAESIFKQVVADCDFAIANLPDQDFWGSQGHVTKSAALMVKARAYLYHGFDASGKAVAGDMNTVATLTSQIINSGKYSLGKYYRGLFSHVLGQQENNPEYLFAAFYLAPNNSKYGLWGFLISTMQFYWQSVHPLPSLLDAYEFSNGDPYNPQDPRVDKKYLFRNRDPRMAQTVCRDTVHWEDGSIDLIGAAKTAYIPYLYWKSCDKEEVVANGGVNTQKTGVPNTAYVPLMRYAEVLLTHAEAVNEVSGPNGQVYQDVNAVRARANMPPLPAGLSQDQMRQRIRNERRVELAFEGFRYFDIKRWRIAGQVLNGTYDGLVNRVFTSPKNYLYPLPEQEIHVNTALKQNPDYQ
ncbi:RagB/SusD family nutrient uptake outer membrane protein [Chitinophaga eiseniae]|uniref:RagB/SusD family nutrient uptake outer membrane protein n=1 Tax=Chitinophaga eiseniae TaxID=634771 RepID=A0A847SU59_9BACT|nr:RagB/SusD family nutrient uptake outer membrane protein [Chitinophaga eiseniae]NLR81356.1 RagB/SusD family nutrient uptake outer membrane protein [Chitinophaga eiseniae]